MSETSAALWREVFAAFDRLLEMEEPQRREELARLSQNHPELHAHVAAMLDADRKGEVQTVAGGLIESLAAGVADSTRRAGSSIGPYALERELGAGGMGEVWHARRADGVFDAPVALKLMHAHL